MRQGARPSNGEKARMSARTRRARHANPPVSGAPRCLIGRTPPMRASVRRMRGRSDGMRDGERPRHGAVRHFTEPWSRVSYGTGVVSRAVARRRKGVLAFGRAIGSMSDAIGAVNARSRGMKAPVGGRKQVNAGMRDGWSALNGAVRPRNDRTSAPPRRQAVLRLGLARRFLGFRISTTPSSRGCR
jgi:hypothetical protein